MNEQTKRFVVGFVTVAFLALIMALAVAYAFAGLEAGKLFASASVLIAGFAIWAARARSFHEDWLARRKSTMDFLTSLRANEVYERHKERLRDEVGLVREIDDGLAGRLRASRRSPVADDPAARHDAEVAESLTYLLNFYEFVCAAVAYKNFDDEFVYATLGPQIIGIYKRYRPYIARSETPLAYLYLTELARRWDERPPSIRWQGRAGRKRRPA